MLFDRKKKLSNYFDHTVPKRIKTNGPCFSQQACRERGHFWRTPAWGIIMAQLRLWLQVKYPGDIVSGSCSEKASRF